MRSEWFQLHTGLSSQGSSARKQSPQNNLLKNQQGLSGGGTKGCQKVRCPLKGAKHRVTHSKTVALKSSKGTAAQKIPGHIGWN